MKKRNFLLVLLPLLSAFTFAALAPEKFTVSAKDSEVHWYAKKVTGAHDGTVALKSGSISFDGDKITGGEFVIDMTTIAVTDINESQGGGKLVGHLKSPDFFDVANHGTATLKIKSGAKTGNVSKTDKAKEYKLQGELTIKGNTQSYEFFAYLTKSGKTLNGRGSLVFDRSKFDIRYGSETFFGSLGDKAIYNDVRLEVKIKASK